MECLNLMKKFLKMKMSAGAANIQSFLIAQLEQCDCTAVWEEISGTMCTSVREDFWIFWCNALHSVVCTTGTVHCSVQRCTLLNRVEEFLFNNVHNWNSVREDGSGQIEFANRISLHWLMMMMMVMMMIMMMMIMMMMMMMMMTMMMVLLLMMMLMLSI